MLTIFKLALGVLVILSSASYSHDLLTTVNVIGHYDNSLGSSEAASQGVIGSDLIKSRAQWRPGEILEYIPGMVVTQHSGDGKANQYFLRGFDADHGTDLALSIDGVPINLVSHAHGQGFADTHFIIPEVIQRLEMTKGPYFTEQGDFATAGQLNLVSYEHFKTSLV